MDVRYGRMRFESEAETQEGARKTLARFAEVCRSMAEMHPQNQQGRPAVTYLLTRGKGAMRRTAHLARYDAFGNVAGSWCGRGYNLISNVPWARPRCKACLRKISKETNND